MYPIDEPYPINTSNPEDSCVVTMSMGNNPLLDESNVAKLLDVLTVRHRKVVILVCDEIHKYEQTISHGMSDSRAAKLAMAAGNEMVLHLQTFIKNWQLSNNSTSCTIHICRWGDITTDSYHKLLDAVVRFRSRFEDELEKSSTYYIQSRLRQATLTDRRLENFTRYTLEELPVQLVGLELHGTQHSILYHPVFCQKAVSATHGAKPTYFSPIENVIKAYRADEEVMADVRSLLPGALDAQLIRVFFDKLA
ncbi:hypothetical protein EJ05DRAFT_487928 [Pseudovirgaria hyperparasitica]|uniref:Uncharacterized protein n=1 Tax=Pseudovirgaria hyperparasitica TaxID=470096 RepID=A0A6A6W1Z1_9PEZI|nr:uncharacterized protein EJ05DRAFT_487928 [Pseudovirgaria hyperparasitica]KAF2756129.1 hypothetical protein EJ05DRAFT_487928 [Pseudovirgaria hyperparasitica]